MSDSSTDEDVYSQNDSVHNGDGDSEGDGDGGGIGGEGREESNQEVEEEAESKVVVNSSGTVVGRFQNIVDAREFARFHQQRFKNAGGGGSSKATKNKYSCAVFQCLAMRFVRVEDGQFVVREKGRHSHVGQVASHNNSLKSSQKQVLHELITGTHIRPSVLQAQAANRGIKLSLEYCRQVTSKGLKRQAVSKDFAAWLEDEAPKLGNKRLRCYG
jgi:hypothetical protein